MNYYFRISRRSDGRTHDWKCCTKSNTNNNSARNNNNTDYRLKLVHRAHLNNIIIIYQHSAAFSSSWRVQKFNLAQRRMKSKNGYTSMIHERKTEPNQTEPKKRVALLNRNNNNNNNNNRIMETNMQNYTGFRARCTLHAACILNVSKMPSVFLYLLPSSAIFLIFISISISFA